MHRRGAHRMAYRRQFPGTALLPLPLPHGGDPQEGRHGVLQPHPGGGEAGPGEARLLGEAVDVQRQEDRTQTPPHIQVSIGVLCLIVLADTLTLDCQCCAFILVRYFYLIHGIFT